MDQLTNRRPSFLDIVNKQRIAYHRLNVDKTTRSPSEIGHYQRTLQAIPLGDVELPRLPMVRHTADGDQRRYIVLGEIAQLPGKLILLEVATGVVTVEYTVDQMLLMSPAELDGSIRPVV